MSQCYNALGSQSTRGENGAQAYCSIPNHRYASSWMYPGGQCRMVSCRHDISQRKDGLEHGFIPLNSRWDHYQRRVCEACANRLSLSTLMSKTLYPSFSLLILFEGRFDANTSLSVLLFLYRNPALPQL